MTQVPPVDISALDISDEFKVYAKRLQDYRPVLPEFSITNIPTDKPLFPHRRLAAVLVLLYERDGMIRVLLTTRSKRLKAHPGEVALPGGGSDLEDGTPIRTALREAHEEVHLPPDTPSMHIIGLLDPFVSLYKIIVTPVVAILTDPTVIDRLVPLPREVHDIFDYPLEAFLDPALAADEELSPKGSEEWPFEEDYHATTEEEIFGIVYRMHHFRSTSMHIRGLTADALILTAQIAFEKQTVYARFGFGQEEFYRLAVQWVESELLRLGKIQGTLRKPPATQASAVA
jgi:8-oxo-dGTP pyrophosphatase MutT (NUDIX family)